MQCPVAATGSCQPGSDEVNYVVEARRQEDWWLLEVPAVPGAVSQVRDLADAETYAREVVAFVLNVEPDTFELTVQAG